MLGDKEKALLKGLESPCPCVTVKYHFEKPDALHYDGGKLAYCQYAKYAQETGNHFHITTGDDACYGKMSLGVIGKPPVTASGQAGYDFGIYELPVGAQQLYRKLPVLESNTIRYVEFYPAKGCNFDPDLLFSVSNFPRADIIMRVTSYTSGDLWGSESSPVTGCAWMHAYPVISEEVNHITTGFCHGFKHRKTYPAGLRMISIPYQKLPEFFTALGEMDWTTITFHEDAKSRREFQRQMEYWQEVAGASGAKVDLH